MSDEQEKKKRSLKRPKWAEDEDSDAFASYVMPGVEGGHDGLPTKHTRLKRTRNAKHELSVDDYIEGIERGDRTILSRTITLIESHSPKHQCLAQEVLQRSLALAKPSIRIGITGVPGVGKSTFIEALGMHLITQGHRVAVLAVDPSSRVTKGSILGDKTRMLELSRQENAFIRPSPTGGDLGGVTRKSRETIAICEAFGFDRILIETVGVGQSETTVRSMVDFFMLLMLAGAGDELQGIKKGVIELADALIINKADGDNKLNAKRARSEYAHALHYLAPATNGWETRAHCASALTGEGISETYQMVERFVEMGLENGHFEKRRKAQLIDWMHAMIDHRLKADFYQNQVLKSQLESVQNAVSQTKKTATQGAEELLELFYQSLGVKRGK